MKQTLLTLIFCGLALLAISQDTSVERTTYGVQTGFLGVYAYKEWKLVNTIALRTEVGLDAELRSRFDNGTDYLLTPVLTVEPRWYYNLNKRKTKSKNISGNSGNFLSIKTSYHPDWFVISSIEGIGIISDLAIVPTWGIRRNIGSHFTYEAGIGIGYKYFFTKRAGYSENSGESTVNLHLRIGYRF